MDDNSTSIEALQAILDMDDVPEYRWHSIRLPRLKEICKLAIEAQMARNTVEIAKTTMNPPPRFISKRKGVDFPCAHFPGPLGDCTEENCRC